MLTIFNYRFKALGSESQIALVSDSQATAERAFHIAQAEIFRIEAKYSRYLPESVLSRINREAKFQKVAIDAETEQLLNYANACFEQSGGLFDITSGVLRTIWDFKKSYIPSDQERKKACRAIGWQKVVFKDSIIQFSDSACEIDFGGIGKEYAVDRSADLLQANGIVAGFVNLGGDMRSWGTPPGREFWHFGIRHPRHNDAVIASIPLVHGALASSGDYERYFDLNGRRYCHILNPKTGLPVADLQAVSVMAPLCTLAGSCSTISMLLGKEKGIAFLQKMKVAAMLVDAQGEVTWINMIRPDIQDVAAAR